MVDVTVLEQLINSLQEAITRLENAQNSSDVNYINQLRTYIFNVQQQINELLNGSG